jgi:hypothetical protein
MASLVVDMGTRSAVRSLQGTLRHRLVYAPISWNDASADAPGHAMPPDSCDVLCMYKVDTIEGVLLGLV